MKKIEEILEKLNSEQVKPVLDTEGAVLVIAGAGSGKTRVLTSRIAYLILEKGVSPSNIMAITFTNKAAGEMKERISAIVGEVGDMWVSTIHSMCVRILRRDIDKIGYDKNFSIYDETDKDKALKAVIEKLGYSDDSLLKIAKNCISSAKNDCLSPIEFRNENQELRIVDDVFKIYQAYESELNSSNALDFDDLLLKTYQLFIEHPDVADYYSNLFKYIHIDEFQDTNKVQFAIVQRLSIKNGNIFVVGDDDQSIYGWRGAKIENILSFDDVYRGAKIYKLEQNYRSTKKILDLANAVIKNNNSRREKSLWTQNGDGARVETFVGSDENSEASYVALQIKSLMARGNANYKDFAVFMRVNALSRAFEQEFTKYGIPYKVFCGFKFFERKEIKDVLSYLRIINNPRDNQSFLRCIASPKRGIGDKTLHELMEFSASYGYSLYEGIDYLFNSSMSASAKTKLVNFKALLDSFKAYSECHSIVETLKFILDSTGFNDQFSEKNEENTSRLYNISELINSAEQFAIDNGGQVTLSDYLNSVSLSTDTDTINSDDAVTIATIHSTKGLEFENVFIAGLDEKIIPISRAIDNIDELEEERRLMYVAITRAKNRLYLLRAMSRYMYGKREYMTESRFYKEAKAQLFKREASKENASSYTPNNNFSYGDEEISSNMIGGYSSNYAKKFLEGAKPIENNTTNSSQYKCGTKVRHVKFGEGVVITVKNNGENTVVDVAFKGVGIKALSVKYAPMEII